MLSKMVQASVADVGNMLLKTEVSAYVNGNPAAVKLAKRAGPKVNRPCGIIHGTHRSFPSRMEGLSWNHGGRGGV